MPGERIAALSESYRVLNESYEAGCTSLRSFLSVLESIRDSVHQEAGHDHSFFTQDLAARISVDYERASAPNSVASSEASLSFSQT